MVISKSKIIVVFFMCCAAAQSQIIPVQLDAYKSSYDVSVNAPRQVEWRLRATDFVAGTKLPRWYFMADVPSELATARHDDYTNSGYHRGHLCPAADRSKSPIDCRRTYRMSNICPMVPKINTGFWKATENLCRRWAIDYDSIDVLVMPIWIDRDTTFIGSNRVAVPHALFKVAWISRTDSILATWFIWNR